MKTSSLRAPSLKTELTELAVLGDLEEISRFAGREVSTASITKADYIPNAVVVGFEEALNKFREESGCYDYIEETSLYQIPVGCIAFFWENESGGEAVEIECSGDDCDCNRNGCGKIYHETYTKQIGVNYLNNKNRWVKAAYAFFQERSTLAF